jgi:hypothetical protein
MVSQEAKLNAHLQNIDSMTKLLVWAKKEKRKASDCRNNKGES